MVSKASHGACRRTGVRRTLGAALVLLSVLLLAASGAQASRLHGERSALPWGRLSQRTLRAHRARLSSPAARPALAGAGSIRGTVSDAATHAGIEGIEVCAYALEVFEEEEAFPYCTLSVAGGDYAITGLPAGEYEVEFSTPFGSTLDYVRQDYEEAVEVAVNEHVSGIDAELVKGGEVEGRVTTAGDAPIAGIEVCALGSNVEPLACAETNSEGVYLATGLPTGSVKVGFRATSSGSNYVTQYYKDRSSYATANPIAVKAEQKKEGIDATMEVGAEIEGTVTSGETGAPSDGTLVCAFSESQGGVGCAITSISGEYTIDALTSGSYTVVFLPEGNYPAEFYNQVFSESEATPVTVTAPEGDARNVDAVLPALPQKVLAPQVTGSATVGGTLTCEPGAYGGVPTPTITLQWLRDGVAIAGATSSTYTAQAADLGHQLQCKVTATNIVGWLWVTTAGIRIAEAAAPPPPPAIDVLPEKVTVLPVIAVASRVTTASQHLAEVRLKCSGGPCKGTLQLLLRVRSRHHTRTIVLATGSFSLRAGTGSTVAMHLTSAGRSRLAHGAHRGVAAKLKVSLDGGATTTHAVSAT